MSKKYAFRYTLWVYALCFILGLIMLCLKLFYEPIQSLVSIPITLPTSGIWLFVYWGLILIFFLAGLKGFMMMLHLGYNYSVEEDGIVVTRFYKQKKFSFSDINSFYKLDREQASDFVYRLNNNLLDVKSLINLPEGFDVLKNLTYLNRYSGVAVKTMQTDMSLGFGRSNVSFPVYIRALKAKQPKGEYILIILKNGNMYFLTPEDADEFYEEFSSKAG
jgi:hypothetical protein